MVTIAPGTSFAMMRTAAIESDRIPPAVSQIPDPNVKIKGVN